MFRINVFIYFIYIASFLEQQILMCLKHSKNLMEHDIEHGVGECILLVWDGMIVYDSLPRGRG